MRKLIVLLLATSCGDGISPVSPGAGAPDSVDAPATPMTKAPPTLRERLAQDEGPKLVITPFDTKGTIQAREVQHDLPYEQIALAAKGGTVQLRVIERDAAAVGSIERFEIELEDVKLFDTGLTLTDLELRLESARETEMTWYSAQNEAYAKTTGNFVLTGWIRGQSGAKSPFESVRLYDVPLELDATLDESVGVVARFRLERLGPTWSWAGLIETRDALLEGRAVEARLTR
jgi:hypothetical protein